MIRGVRCVIHPAKYITSGAEVTMVSETPALKEPEIAAAD